MDSNKDYLDWDDANRLIYNLIEDGRYCMAMLILIGINTGFKINRIRKLRWVNVLNKHEINTGGVFIHLNDDFYALSEHIYTCIGEPDKLSYVLLSHKKVPYSTQRINILLKGMNIEYKLGVDKLTTHSLRKTFGRRIVEESKNPQAALSSLSRYFNHASTTITIDYLNLVDFKEKNYIVLGIKNSGDLPIKNSPIERRYNPGYCYLMKDGNYPDVIKIGISSTPVLREKTLGHQIPNIKLYKVLKTENMREIESALHNRYKNKHVRGEWYNLTNKDIKDIVEEYGFYDFET